MKPSLYFRLAILSFLIFFAQKAFNLSIDNPDYFCFESSLVEELPVVNNNCIDFETTVGMTSECVFFGTPASSDYFNIGTGFSIGYTGFNGSYFALDDMDSMAGDTCTIYFDPIDISIYTQPVFFAGLFAGASSYPSWSTTRDFVLLEYSTDNTVWNFGLKFKATNITTGNVPVDEFDNVIGSELTTTATPFSFAVNDGGASQIYLRISINNYDRNGMDFAFDEFRVQPVCGLSVGEGSTACNTSPAQTYIVTIPYTGADLSVTLPILANYTGSGIVSFNPVIANGNIVISDIPVGENWAVTISGGEGACNETRSGISPRCASCPQVSGPQGNIIRISTNLTEANAADQNAAAALSPYETAFASWNAAVTMANALNIDGDVINDVAAISFEYGYYNNEYGNSNNFSGTLGSQLEGIKIFGNHSIIRLPDIATQVTFATILADNVSFQDLNFDNFNSTVAGIVSINNVTDIVFNNCTFNASDRSGDAVAITNDLGVSTRVTFNCCLFSNNKNITSANSALRIEGDNNLKVDIVQTDFICNERQFNGGAIYISDNTSNSGPAVSFTGGTFANNHARGTSGTGGAIYMTRGTLQIEDVDFIDNSCEATVGTEGGGAIFFLGDSLSVLNSDFSGNSSLNTGGAINAKNFDNYFVSIKNSNFIGNSASSKGGAVYVGDRAETCVVNTLFYGNASQDGSAIYARAGNGAERTQTLFYLSGTTVSNNTGVAAVHINGAETSDFSDSETEDVITLFNSTLCNNIGTYDYLIVEDLLTGLAIAGASTDFIGINNIGVGAAVGDYTADYNMGTCPDIPAMPVANAVACPILEFIVDTDTDNDGIADVNDLDPNNPFICGDADFDGCEDCAYGVDGLGPLPDSDPNNDGPDNDSDGICDSSDTDDDNDGVVDVKDSEPFNPDVQ